MAALEDDLNTPLAISHLHELAGQLNKARTTADQARLKGALLASGALLGILGQTPENWFRWTPAGGASLSDQEINQLVTERLEARRRRDFTEADRLRRLLTDYGVLLEDGAGATQWRRS
jgi:cysteinyl-tRNA synthetase